VWQLCRVEGVNLNTIIAQPSSALLSAIQTVDATVSAAHRLEAERDRADVELGAKARQHQRQWR